MRHAVPVLLAALLLAGWPPAPAAAQIGGANLQQRPIDFTQPRRSGTIRGVVFHDLNGSGGKESDEPGVEGVLVSNGRLVTRTNARGEYRIPIDERGGVVFVCKPRGFRVKADEHNVARFARVHKPEGSPVDLEYPGVPRTGRLPDRVDFPLTRRTEPFRTRVAIIGDPQPRDTREIDWMAQRLVSEMIDLDVEGVISLGDIVFDDLSLYKDYDRVMSAIGQPVYNVIGNHDLNFDVETDELSDETWERVYGPTNYAFQIANAHFVVLDNVFYEGERNNRSYRGHFNDDAMTFLKSYLRHTPKEELVVVAFHIPLWDVDNTRAFLGALGQHPHTLSLSSHWHEQRHVVYTAEDGWSGTSATGNTHVHHHEHDDQHHHSHDIHPHDHGTHHHLCHATACGSWWRGAPGPDGSPHATMRDGTPIGYSVLTIEPDAGYMIDFKAAGRPASEQMSVSTPTPLSASAIGRQEAEVVVNVWAGAPGDTVQMRLLRTEPGRRPHVTGWLSMAFDPRPDPFYERAKNAERTLKAGLRQDQTLGWRELPEAVDAQHIWSLKLPAGVSPGAYTLHVRWIDQWERVHEARRALRIEP